MAYKVRLKSGLYAHRLTPKEQDKIWSEVVKPIYNSNTPFYTPMDNLEYYIIESKIVGNICIDTIKANNIVKTIKADICKIDEKTLKTVRQIYKQLT